jgi:hypothetical protein
MIKRKSSRKWCWVIPVVMLFSLFLVSTVYAEDEVLPEPAAAEGTESGEEVGVEDEITDPVPVILDEGEPLEEPLPEEELEVVPGGEPNLETDEEVGGIEPVVNNENELVEETEASADVAVMEETVTEESQLSPTSATVDSSDPYFKIGTITYAFKFTGTCPANTATYICQESDTPLDAAIQYLMDHPLMVPTDRKVYVEGGDYEGVKIDGLTYPNLAQLNGLIGIEGSSATSIKDSLLINAPANGFTLSGFTVYGLVSITNAAGTIKLSDMHVFNDEGDGIYVKTTGSIEMTDVESSNNSGRGAELYSTGPASTSVKLTNCEIDHNDAGAGYAGLTIGTWGTVTLNGVTASVNSGNGANIFGFKNLTISDCQFNDNNSGGSPATSGYGLNIQSDSVAPVTLTSVIASGNANTNINIVTWGNITATNISTRWSTIGAGLIVDSSGSTAPATVTINFGEFSDNDADGLHIECKGNITLMNIIAERNTTGDGIFLDNCLYGSGVCGGTGGVSLNATWIGNWMNEFQGNGLYGIEIYSKGTVALSNLDSYGNGAGGIYVKNDYGTGNVTLNTTYVGSWYNWVGENSGDTGLIVLSCGNILVDSTVAGNNAKHGMDLQNDTSSSPRTIQVKNSEANGNQGDGLHILASGAVTLQNLRYVGSNGQSGSGNGGSISSNSGNITITGPGVYDMTQFNDNHDYGFYIYSNGNVTISKVEAVNNGIMGLYVDVTNLPGKTVSLTNGRFNDNGSSGLEVYTLGNIALNSIEAVNNDNFGAFLDNCLQIGSSGICQGSGTVTIIAPMSYSNDFNNNASGGLHIESKGNILLTNINASNNWGGFGAYLRNSFFGTTGNVTITASPGQFNYFSSYNKMAGLLVDSFGTISLLNINASENYGRGAELYNDLAPTPKNVTVINGIFNDNNNDGLYILTKGVVTLSGIMAHRDSITDDWLDVGGVTVNEYIMEGYQTDEGWYYWNPDRWHFQADSGGGTVKISLESDDFMPQIYLYDQYGTFIDGNSNDLDESYIELSFESTASEYYYIEIWEKWGSGGNYILTLNDLEKTNEWDPDVNGIEVDTIAGSGGITVNNSTVMGFGVNAYDNSVDGLRITSAGNANLKNIDSYHNGRRGLSVDLTNSSRASLTINTAHLDNNWIVGLVANCNGPMTWINGSASGNVHEGGAGLMSWSGSPLASVTVTLVDFNDTNGTPSLFIWTGGLVNLTNINAINNPSSVGVMIFNNSGTAPVTIKSTGGGVCEFSNNDVGLNIVSRGVVTLNGLVVDNNGTGASINNTEALTPLAVNILNSTFNYNSSGNGLEVNSLGNIVLTNVEANGNSLGWRYLDISEHGQSQYEHLGNYNNNDHYWFDGTEGVEIAIELDSDDFEPYFNIFDNNWNYLGSADSGGGSNASMKFTPDWDGQYILEISGGYGFYDLSLNDGDNNYENDFTDSSGVWLDNCQYDDDLHACTGSGFVTINNSSARDFSGNNAYGMHIVSKGNVSVTNANAVTNGNDGLLIQNELGGASTVTVKSTISSQYSYFNRNLGDGIDIHTKGPVSLTAVMGNENSNSGVFCEMNPGGSLVPFTMLNTRFTGNGSDGIYASVNGPVTIIDVRSGGNRGTGIFILNDESSSPQPVTVKKATLNNNEGDGLGVFSRGAILVDNITAESNGVNGAYLKNYYTGATGGVTIASSMGENHFDNNGDTGLIVYTYKSISGSKITAQWNRYGLDLQNSGGVGLGTISLNTVRTTYNACEGIYIDANGAVLLTGITSLNNGYDGNCDGVWIQTTAFPVLITKSVAQGNQGSGFDITLSGPYLPIFNNVLYMGNDADNSGDPNINITQLY